MSVKNKTKKKISEIEKIRSQYISINVVIKK